MTLQHDIKEVRVRLRRGEQKVDIFWGGEGYSATWRDGAWVPGVEAPEAVRADLRSIGAWLTRTVGVAADSGDDDSGEDAG